MARITRLIFFSLEGDTPAELELPPLRTANSTFQTVRNTFLRFAESSDFAVFCRDVAELPVLHEEKAADAINLVYLMGHAWKGDAEYRVAIIDHGQSQLLRGRELLERLAQYLVGPALLIIDTCNAGALLRQVESRGIPNLTCLCASEEDQTAHEFGLDRSTRFAVTLAGALDRQASRDEIEFIQIAFEVRDALAAPSLVAAQTVEIWTSGRPIRLSAKSDPGPSRRAGRTYLYLRALFIVAGVLVATTTATVVLYYRNHVQVQVSSGPLESMGGVVEIVIKEERPDANGDDPIETRELYRSGVTRFKLPATDLVLVVKGSFRDGKRREIRFPVLARRSFSLKEKFYDFTLPSDVDIRQHPGMAYVMQTTWHEGSERISVTSSQSFWIDLEPVTAESYLPMAEEFVRQGKIESFQSVLLTEQAQSRAVEATNLKQVPKLMGQLQNIFDVIHSEQRATRQPDPSDKTPLPEAVASCRRCPAKLTMDEAKLYCASQGKRLPTDLEWELSARGVDGRLYPWGNQFDGSRANVPGLPEKGQETRLVAVDFYSDSRSPFGLLDTVGNAGDWVDSRGGYERTFMGGTYRFNKEDALTYSSMPDTGDPLPLLPVTARCVSLSVAK
jgi:formylglycine-generating enzyme required for sulfatase activity